MNFDKDKKYLVDDVVIIGSGIAGMTCALYLGRACVKTTIIGDWAESSLAASPEVKNYPGIPNTDGVAILSNLHNQMQELSTYVRSIQENCVSLYEDKESKMAVVETKNYIISTTKVVIATGRRPRLLGISGEEELLGNGISTCAYCDGNLYEGKSIAIVGGGNSAVDESIYLSGIVEHIDLFVRKNYLRADEIQQGILMNKENVSVLFNTEIKSIGKMEDGSIHIKDNYGKERSYSGIFYAIGSIPNTEFINLESFEDIQKKCSYDGYVPEIMISGTNTIFSAGDVSYRENKRFQAILAAAEGVKVALDII